MPVCPPQRHALERARLMDIEVVRLDTALLAVELVD
jgi:hypothetical protein